MERIEIEATKSTPFVILDEIENKLHIKGQSYPENSVDFYDPIVEWIEEYIENLGSKEAVLELNMLYLNTSSSKCMMDLIYIFDEAYENGKNVKIQWICHPTNEAMIDFGEEYGEDLSVPFEIVEVTE